MGKNGAGSGKASGGRAAGAGKITKQEKKQNTLGSASNPISVQDFRKLRTDKEREDVLNSMPTGTKIRVNFDKDNYDDKLTFEKQSNGKWDAISVSEFAKPVSDVPSSTIANYYTPRYSSGIMGQSYHNSVQYIKYPK